MRNRKIVCGFLFLMDVIAGILMLVWKFGMETLGWLSIIMGLLGSLEICFSYQIAKGELNATRRITDRYPVEKTSPSRLLVMIHRISGWVLCFLPLFFLMLPI